MWYTIDPMGTDDETAVGIVTLRLLDGTSRLGHDVIPILIAMINTCIKYWYKIKLAASIQLKVQYMQDFP